MGAAEPFVPLTVDAGQDLFRDLGGFHEGNMGSTTGDNRAVAEQYAAHKQNANAITRKLSASKYGNQVMPRSPMRALFCRSATKNAKKYTWRWWGSRVGVRVG